MSKLDIVGRSFGSETIATKDDNGDWKVIVKMQEKRLVRGEDWEPKELSAMCTSDTFEKAYSVAMESVLKQFDDTLSSTKSDSMFPLEEEEVEALEEVKEE